MRKEHRIAILKIAIKKMRISPASVEGYAKHYWEQFCRKCHAANIEPDLDKFYELIPQKIRRLQADATLPAPYSDELLERFEDELEELEGSKAEVKPPAKAAAKKSDPKKA